jgi:hypothetical protein
LFLRSGLAFDLERSDALASCGDIGRGESALTVATESRRWETGNGRRRELRTLDFGRAGCNECRGTFGKCDGLLLDGWGRLLLFWGDRLGGGATCSFGAAGKVNVDLSGYVVFDGAIACMAVGLVVDLIRGRGAVLNGVSKSWSIIG